MSLFFLCSFRGCVKGTNSFVAHVPKTSNKWATLERKKELYVAQFITGFWDDWATTCLRLTAHLLHHLINTCLTKWLTREGM